MNTSFMKDILLGVDVGTTAAKAALFDADGHALAVAQADYPLNHLRPGWVEQQPENWWRAVCAAVRQALDAVPKANERVIGLALSAQAPALIALDADGLPLRPALIWMDRRSEAEAQQLAEAVDVYGITGNRADAFYVAPKLRWLKQHEPETLARARWFVQITGYLNFRLTSAFTLDPAHAGLLQLRDCRAGAWSAALCDLCGVDPTRFPPITPAHQVIGGVSHAAAEATGLAPGTPVLTGTVDGAAAALEAGAVNTGMAAEMTGTSTVLLMPNAGGVTEPAFTSMPHAVSGVDLLFGAMVASGASLRWFRDQLGQLEVQEATRQQIDPFDLLTQQAAATSSDLIFLPYMMGERAPIWHTQARGVFFGLSLATPKAALVRAVLEGTAFALRHNVDVARAAGVELTEVRSVGGGTRSALWNQIKADVLGLPVLLPETSVGAPFGDAVLVGMGLGIYPNVSAILRDIVRVRTRYEPDMRAHQRYTQLYGVFRSIYDHLRPDFDQLAVINEL